MGIKGGQNIKLKNYYYPHIYSDKNSIIYLFAYLIFIRPGLRKYLKSVVKGLNWYLGNKRPIPNNYFGHHKWFSQKN